MTSRLTSTRPSGHDSATQPRDGALALVVNGEPVRAGHVTLSDLLVAHGFDGATVATAVNGDFVPAGERSARQLRDGDRIEVLSPRQGG